MGAVEEVDGASLAIGLREDAAVLAFIGRDAAPDDGGFVGVFSPAKLVGIPLRQGSARMGVLVHWKFEGKSSRILQKTIG